MRPGARELLLAAVLLLLAVRLSTYVVSFGEGSLQMDFSAFYAAGKAVGAGLSPYVNHIDAEPPIWDGIDTFRHSRFLYPPLVARLFQPLAALPYHAAKYAWMGLSLAALSGALLIAARLAAVPREAWRFLAIGSIALAYFPLLTLLERGQNDTLTLLLVIAAVALVDRPRTAAAAGVLLALATLLKLHCVFVVPFLLVRRQWRVLGGYAAGGAALLVVGLLVDGPARVRDYAFDDLPRISRYGEGGTREMRLPPERLGPLRQMLATGSTTMDGRRYRQESLSFSLNASLVRTPVGRSAWRAIRRVAPGFPPAQVSLVFLVPFWLLLLGWQRRFGVAEGGRAKLVYWQAVMVVILLCAPVSWTMGTVWLLPVAVLLVSVPARRLRLPPTVLCGVGLLLAAVPDPPDGWTIARSLADHRYVVAELLCLAGLLGWWRLDAREREPVLS